LRVRSGATWTGIEARPRVGDVLAPRAHQRDPQHLLEFVGERDTIASGSGTRPASVITPNWMRPS
jgi:hypothetical protein